MLYTPKYFIAQELVPESVYKDRGDKAMQLIDPRLLRAYDKLRGVFGSCTINNWHKGGNFSQSGLRTPDSKYYSPYSQHSFGRAGDGKFTDAEPEEVRLYILANPDKFEDITFLELDTPTWVHVDVRNCKRITTWSPKK
jgi:hypothetical protein|tara:strand:- start:9205 stop:9621 length:417 start_codon:yes stop_codon:yes gene_type:complete